MSTSSDIQYGAVVADPPWAFETWSGKGKGRSPENHYAIPSREYINYFPVQHGIQFAKDAVLFLWVPDAQLEWGLRVVDLWGFVYKTIAFVWVKPSIGLGYWTRKEAEVCLLGARGKPKRVDAGVRQVIHAPRREHSRKPDEVYERIERLVAGPYLELFARSTRKGWDSFGNEVGKFGEVA